MSGYFYGVMSLIFHIYKVHYCERLHYLQMKTGVLNMDFQGRNNKTGNSRLAKRCEMRQLPEQHLQTAVRNATNRSDQVTSRHHFFS